ncbi:unnamed protein product [Durusdinium trenchii]|uniref:Uncharacterized protein n=1 Tax=Durusdinium trenchii TaxID=1381693 RepID=A0ABP0SEA9_9DINO
MDMDFMQRLLLQKWRGCDCLHLDIGPTQEQDILDDILVQISLWGCLQAESMIAVVPRDYTFIELANLSTPVLLELTVCSLVSLTKADFEMCSFYVSPEVRSPSQVVAKILEAYFDPKTLQKLQIEASSVRKELVDRLVEAAIDFTTRAVTSGRLRQREQHAADQTAAAAAEMFEESEVPDAVRALFRSQATGDASALPDFKTMSTTDLEARLGRMILPLNQELGKPAEGSSYVVSWRFSFLYKERVTWAFLDEVNTCEHMGLVTEILCHHRVLGKPLPEKLVLLAACNPYRKKAVLTTEARRAQAQLVLGDTSQRRKMSRLVYSVQELPEALYDFLYDFGFLGTEEEESYVEAMVEPLFPSRQPVQQPWAPCVKDLIIFSQEFTAENQPDCLLSLRDVKRCVELIKWFQESLRQRQESCHRWEEDLSPAAWSEGWKEGADALEEEITFRSVLNALVVSYHCRLPTHKLREVYRQQVAQIFENHGKYLPRQNRQQTWEGGNILNWLKNNEMTRYIELMKLPEMTVMMVCILNQIPIFAVGKPGNSKSLALRILHASLRGPDSEDPYLRNFPRLYVISYQGSEVSTSEGITKVFEKAKTYKESIAKDALVLVHFDEIGLAEASPNNPLKVRVIVNGEFSRTRACEKARVLDTELS